VQAYLAALTFILLIGMVLARSLALRRKGIRAIHFGKVDRKDFLIPPFALFYLYLVCANAFTWPTVSTQVFFHSDLIAWVGVGLCLAGLLLFLWSLVSFGRSFRAGSARRSVSETALWRRIYRLQQSRQTVHLSLSMHEASKKR